MLQAAAARSGLDLALTPYPIGWKAYEESRSTLAPETVAALRNHMGWILGPTFAGEYPDDDPIKGHPSGYLRRNFALFANVRPVRAWPQLEPLIGDLDITILRENTEGFYPDRNLAWGYGEFKPTPDVGISLRVITAPACERFARFAFDYAATASIDRLAVVHKRTALPQPKVSSSAHSNGCTPNTLISRWNWSVSIPSAPPSRAIPTATGSSPPPISLATSCPTRPPGSPAGSASPRH